MYGGARSLEEEAGESRSTYHECSSEAAQMDLRFAALRDQYYTNESIRLQLDISNGEDDESIAKLVVHIPEINLRRLFWGSLNLPMR